jgi:hypothetical protein
MPPHSSAKSAVYQSPNRAEVAEAVYLEAEAIHDYCWFLDEKVAEESKMCR